MRRALAAALSGLALAGCNLSGGPQEGEEIVGTGQGGSRSYDVSGFDSLALGGHQDVIVSVGPAASVRAEGPAEALDRLDIRLDGTRLRIGSRRTVDLVRGNQPPVTVHITMPAIAKAAIGGSGDMRIDRVQGSRFEADVAGSGDLQIGTIEVEEGRFSVAGSGSVRAAGRAADVHVDVAGAGDVDLSALDSRTARVAVVGAGDVHVRASDAADVNVLGAGDVTVTGGARCAVRRHGSGEVRCGG